MSIINNGLLLASGADAATTYQISRSIRLNSADSAYFSRTPGSAGNRTIYTWSFWIKRWGLGEYHVFRATSDASNYTEVYFGSNDKLNFQNVVSGTQNTRLVTTQVFRDTSAWYHFVIAINGSTSAKIYVNGTEITAYDTTVGPGSSNHQVNNTVSHTLGSGASTGYANIYLADVYLLDGTATTPSTFAETDAITGQWVPKTPTGISYGTNGFRLTFSDNSGTTSTTLGKDAAGSNNWTPNNFSVASGSGNDSLVDSPTSYGTDTGAGNEVRGNYATLNPLVNISGHTFRNGNLEVVTSSSNYGTFVSTIAMPSSGKWYAEVYISATSGYPLVGIAGTGCTFGTTSYLGGQATMYAYYGVNGNKYNNGTSPSYGATYTTGDTIGIAYDADAGTITFYKNGVSQGQAYSGITSGSYYFAGNEFNTASGTQIWNFGARAFSYQAPSGYKALCDTNLTSPTIALPSTVFDVKLWTGDGASTRTIGGFQFSPDFVWIKNRTTSGWQHVLYDTIRGPGTNSVVTSLSTDQTRSEASGNDANHGYLSSFTSDGFGLTKGSQAGGDYVNFNAWAYVAWTWDAGSSNTTDNNGSITSTRRTNTTSGCSVVTWTGNGTNGATIGHGLNAAPSLIIAKRRSAADPWPVYHVTTGPGNTLYLNTTAANYADTSVLCPTSAPSSTTFSVGTSGQVNTSGQTYVAYCFAPVAGYSSFGSYIANASADGPFVYLGFKPRWIMIKAATDAGDMSYASWLILDTSRSSYNICTESLYANASYQEGLRGNGTSSGTYLDILSNGFKIKYNGSEVNGVNGQTYVYACFAENPFQYARAR